ncbi:hypothetical protein KSP39_PZI006815 [Platanthera zijinensis]|uniref:Morc S5 domain-containing protein n=1 Tax=Platanthera zijinensis TaxID=2320716 RepID=A0AAP0G9N0_9ASPA
MAFIDKISNLGNNHALLIQDNGGGMDPESIRHCMSFGFSDKQSNTAIGHYGNGFKSSSMRLGADVIVFSRCLKERNLTQSVGLLSYTFLRQAGCNDIIVPMVDYNFELLTGGLTRLVRRSEKHFCENLSIILRWSPYANEEELLNQFNYIGDSGTRIIVYNLWQNDNGYPELDFDTNEKDILVSGALNEMDNSRFSKDLNEKHIGNCFRYSLRAYSSILYLRLPENFRIFLRENLVVPHYVAEDLIYTQVINYKPQIARAIEVHY